MLTIYYADGTVEYVICSREAYDKWLRTASRRSMVRAWKYKERKR